jgi:metallo-beta-lactamase family protein
VEVRATIRTIDAYSGHADRAGLMHWILARLPVSGGIFLVHGEDQERVALRASLIEAGLDGNKIHLPGLDEVWGLTGRGARALTPTHPPRIDKAAVAKPDWHNDYAATVLALADSVRKMRDDKKRAALLAKVREALAADDPG